MKNKKYEKQLKLTVKNYKYSDSDKIDCDMETRLNSPRTKMAEELTCNPGTWELEIVLKPEDIPGSSFTDKEIGKQKLNQLKFWFRCRRIRQTGNKNELLEI